MPNYCLIAETQRSESPLHAAAVAGHVRIAELLIAKGADVNAKDLVSMSVILDDIHTNITDRKLTENIETPYNIYTRDILHSWHSITGGEWIAMHHSASGIC